MPAEHCSHVSEVDRYVPGPQVRDCVDLATVIVRRRVRGLGAVSEYWGDNFGAGLVGVGKDGVW